MFADTFYKQSPAYDGLTEQLSDLDGVKAVTIQ